METFGKFMTIVLVMIISPIVCGFVILKLWGWFVVPTFDLEPLRLVEAIGLMFLINYIRTKREKEVKKEKFWKELTISIGFIIGMSAIALLSGWLVSLFM